MCPFVLDGVALEQQASFLVGIEKKIVLLLCYHLWLQPNFTTMVKARIQWHIEGEDFKVS